MPVSTHLTQYSDTTDRRPKLGKTYVFDSSTGTIIAELTEEAATQVRKHAAGTFNYDGAMISAHA